MNKNKLIFAAIIVIVLLLFGAFVMVEWLGPPRTYELEISGAPGMEIVGEAEVDGQPHQIAEKLPAKVTFKGIRATFAFVPRQGKTADSITVRIVADGAFLMESKTSGAPGIAGWVYQPRLLPGWREKYNVANLTEESAAKLRK
jgi:hypothetical protein